MSGLSAWAARSRALPAALLLVLLCKDSQNLLRAEFYAEDGLVWYAQAYEQGIVSLLNPEGGYLNTAQRLVALLSQLLPLAWAPTLFNLCAWLVQAGLVLFLLSARLDEAWPQRGARALFAVLLAVMPAAHETFGILTNAHWYLALWSFLVLAGAAPRSPQDWTLDMAVLLLGGLSGPFCVFLLPVAAQQWWRHPDRIRALRAALLLGCALAQLAFLFGVGSGRAALPLGATPELLLRIIALIPLYAETGIAVTSRLAQFSLWQTAAVSTAGGLLTLAVFALGWRRGTPLLRQFLLFCLLMFAAALYQPMVEAHADQWPALADRPPSGGRYFLFPMLAWWSVLFSLAGRAGRAAAAARLLLAFTFLLAVPLDWPRWRPDQATAFRAQARAFEAAPPATRFEFAIKPVGMRPLILVKKGDGG